jgi:hypothetical protein
MVQSRSYVHQLKVNVHLMLFMSTKVLELNLTTGGWITQSNQSLYTNSYPSCHESFNIACLINPSGHSERYSVLAQI